MIRGLKSAEVPNEIERLLPFLQNFADRSHERWTVESLLHGILGRDRQVWVANDYQAVMLTSVSDRHVSIDAAAGTDRHDWYQDFLAEVTAWAKALGKRRLIILCRPGWARELRQEGFHEAHREMVRDVI